MSSISHQKVNTSSSRDTRIPTSIHHIGKYTIRIYDEAAYQAMLEQYGTPGKGTTKPATHKRMYNPIPKRKTRYSWVKPLEKRVS